MSPEVATAWIALGGTLFGGAMLKLTEKWLSKSKEQDDTAAALRSELRVEVQSLREELRRVEEDLDTWRSKYYTLMDQFITLKAELEAAMYQIKTGDQVENLDKPTNER